MGLVEGLLCGETLAKGNRLGTWGRKAYEVEEPTWEGVVVGVVKGGITINETFPFSVVMKKKLLDVFKVVVMFVRV